MRLRLKYADDSVVQYLSAVENAFRLEAISVSCDEDKPMAWGVAILHARKECHEEWGDRKDLLRFPRGQASAPAPSRDQPPRLPPPPPKPLAPSAANAAASKDAGPRRL